MNLAAAAIRPIRPADGPRMSGVGAALLSVMFFGLALDKPGDTAGLWQSPLAPIGGLLIENLNKTFDVPSLKVSLLQILVLLLAGIRVFRVASDPAESVASRRPARPMMLGLAVSGCSALLVCAYGLVRGGDGQMCKIQLQAFIPLLIVAYLGAISFRGLQDYKTLGKVVVIAGCWKALVALWVRNTLGVPFGEGRGELSYATTHGDSMLFACAASILLSMFFERPVRRNKQLVILLMPILLAGIVANNRRLAWVQVGSSLLVLLALNPRSRPTRALIRGAVYAAPVILLYVAVGWNSGSRIFQPVQLLRSVGDANVDRSTLYRDGENFDLVSTFREHPFFGTGFGHPFEQAVQLDDISSFKEWRYLPHNSILGLWAFGGAAGFTGIWTALIVGQLLIVRSHAHATSPDMRITASCAMTSIVVYTIHCWGDIGFTEPLATFLAGSGLALAAQLATATGAWPSAAAARTVSPYATARLVHRGDRKRHAASLPAR